MHIIRFSLTSWIVILFLLSTAGCKDKVTLNTLLGEMTDRSNLTYFPDKEFTHRQFSSYNRASVSPDSAGWFANQDMSHFIRVEENDGRREFVMFDAEGPGAIVRWWMTFYKAQDGVIRIYIDNNSSPVAEGRPDELLSGSMLCSYPLSASVQEGAKLGEAGRDYDHNFYLPIPFSKHCKITYECDSLRLLYDYEGIAVPDGYWWPDVFYNIGYRAYRKDTKVESVSVEALDKARQLIDNTGKRLLDDNISSDFHESDEKVLIPGDSLTIEFSKGQYAVNKLTAEIKADNFNQALRSTVIQAAFDGKMTIWVPAGEFFGAGYTPEPHQAWMNKTDGTGSMQSYWIMPFRERCVIKFVNHGNETIKLKVTAGFVPYEWRESSLYFGASWQEYYRIRSRDDEGSPFDLNFINIKGQGVYAGDQITLYNDTYHWWGEGDEKIFVDDEKFPSSFGTGTEDYYGYSFARQEPFSHPFVCQPVGIGNMARGVTVNMRHRSLDAIPFNKRISSDMELWHWADIKMNYALTSYYYIRQPYETNIVTDIESVKRKVAVTRDDFASEE